MKMKKAIQFHFLVAEKETVLIKNHKTYQAQSMA